MVTWAEEPTPREWAVSAAWSQMRADRRRLEERAERAEFWREVKIDVLGGLAVVALLLLLVGLRLWVMA